MIYSIVLYDDKSEAFFTDLYYVKCVLKIYYVFDSSHFHVNSQSAKHSTNF